ncbi:MAG: hypothetical protein AAGA80_05795 [Cyanobacteria bacterium P01_F01_bin.143]
MLEKKSLQIITKTFNNNCNSDYTEKIKQLDKSFDYEKNRHNYWCFPEQSILYGTPFYQEASADQKIALNHLYWFIQYSKIATDEVGTVFFNQLTTSVLAQNQDCTTLCQELDLETVQEKNHIHAFQRIGYLTRKALLGKTILSYQSNQIINKNWLNYLYRYSYQFSRFFSQKILGNPSQFLEDYLTKSGKNNNFRLPVEGLISRLPIVLRIPTAQMLFLQCGTSGFIASQFYAIRLIANLMLKNWEYNYVKFLRTEKKAGRFIPVPTQVSNYHFLDEAFHTTMSRFISQELYQNKAFAPPKAYEKMIGNLMIYSTQLNLDGLSAVIPYRFIKDNGFFVKTIFKLMTSSLFELSEKDAIYWLEKCFTQEHDGFHLAYKNHQRLLLNLKQTFASVDYLWAANREMKMASSVRIESAMMSSKKAFQEFSQLV